MDDLPKLLAYTDYRNLAQDEIAWLHKWFNVLNSNEVKIMSALTDIAAKLATDGQAVLSALSAATAAVTAATAAATAATTAANNATAALTAAQADASAAVTQLTALDSSFTAALSPPVVPAPAQQSLSRKSGGGCWNAASPKTGILDIAEQVIQQIFQSPQFQAMLQAEIAAILAKLQAG